MNIARELIENFPLYAEHQLKIKPKVGPLVPFKLNRAQLYLHERAENQLRRIGMVRLLVLKGRQMGLSTYIGGRFYHKTVSTMSMNTFIFAHEADSSNSLYEMVKRYYDTSTDPQFRPTLGKSNAKELTFPNLGSGYKVGTAGNKSLGRSKTVQLLHWSEVAFSPHADEHSRGILQTVPREPGTEIILESTADGQGNYFYRQAMQAMAGQGDYEIVFIPWYWMDEYTLPANEIPEDFELEQPRENQDHPSEQEYFELFRDDGLTIAHMAWRRKKIFDDFQNVVENFMKEYPFTVHEAFVASAADAYIKPILFEKSFNTAPVGSNAPLVMGVDPARMGGDQFKLVHRKGRNVTKVETYPPMRIDQSTARLIQDINKYKPAVVNIDAGGLGVGLYDNLVGAGFGNIVNKVDFGANALNPEINKNMTAEMFRCAREWLEDIPNSMHMITPDQRTRIQSQISARRYEWYRNSILQMESKSTFKKEFGFSPDDGDAFLLTFAKPINNAAGPNLNRMGNQVHVAPQTWDVF